MVVCFGVCVVMVMKVGDDVFVDNMICNFGVKVLILCMCVRLLVC